MVMQAKNRITRSLKVAGLAGGMARQYRVQFLSPSDHSWRMYGSYPRRELAEAGAAQLVENGLTVRVVAYECCPAGL